ncbi:hypothetical protein Ae201684P_012183 [Aphanomyces euteiches]|nr:hypothetical protein Ae201684P_012183 [Aphanomyces euteiches]
MTPSAPWTRHYRSLLVFGSFVCAIVVMYADVTEAIVTLQVLYGVHATEKGGSYYYAPTIPRFIHMNILNQTRKLHELQDQRVLQLHQPFATKPATPSTMNRTLCLSFSASSMA